MAIPPVLPLDRKRIFDSIFLYERPISNRTGDRHRVHIRASIDQFFVRFRIVENFINLDVELRDDRLWCSLWRKHARPQG